MRRTDRLSMYALRNNCAQILRAWLAMNARVRAAAAAAAYLLLQNQQIGRLSTPFIRAAFFSFECEGTFLHTHQMPKVFRFVVLRRSVSTIYLLSSQLLRERVLQAVCS